MKKVLAFLMLLVMSTGVQATELSWLTNYGDAMKLARTTARPLLLVISRDDLLPVSVNRLSPSQATQSSHDLLGAYVLCRIDANSGYGKRVAEAFRVTEFPHSVIIDKTTKRILYSKTGEATDEAWKVTLTKYQGEATLHEVVELQPQTTVRSPSRAYRETYYSRQPATYSFRQPAFCNT
jgi:hypothetical protein